MLRPFGDFCNATLFFWSTCPESEKKKCGRDVCPRALRRIRMCTIARVFSCRRCRYGTRTWRSCASLCRRGRKMMYFSCTYDVFLISSGIFHDLSLRFLIQYRFMLVEKHARSQPRPKSSTRTQARTDVTCAAKYFQGSKT